MQVYCCPTIQMFSLTPRAADFQRSGLTVKENLELTYRIFKALNIIIFYANKSEKLFSFVVYVQHLQYVMKTHKLIHLVGVICLTKS